ncbi:MAG: PDZ domain-containing protein [Acidobacteria bacterium]|nr:PDZ domain-containing protein [Acidobacteriota bacterium]
MKPFLFLTLFAFLGLSSVWAQPTPGAFLGVYLADVNEAKARDLRLSEARGAIVGKVLENSPAAKAGLRENDVILSFDDQAIQMATNVYVLLNETLPESRVMLKIMREGVERDVTVIVGERQGGIDSTAPNPEPYHRTKTWRLGVKVAPLSPQLAEFFGVSGNAGSLVTEVEPRTLADRAGIKAGDCLLTLNGEPVPLSTDLNRTFNEIFTKANNKITVKIVRDRKEQELVVKSEESEN